jgi:hypothetical protein
MGDAAYGDIEKILETMRPILERNGFGQARTVAKTLLALRQGDNADLVRLLNGLDFWGGAGSIVDIIIYLDKKVTPDNQLLMLAEIELVNEMERLGIASPRAIHGREDLRSSVDYGNRVSNR